jgi:hypothetical protein
LFRSFKNFDVDAYVNDLDKIRLLNESCDNVTDIDLEYDHFLTVCQKLFAL